MAEEPRQVEDGLLYETDIYRLLHETPYSNSRKFSATELEQHGVFERKLRITLSKVFIQLLLGLTHYKSQNSHTEMVIFERFFEKIGNNPTDCLVSFVRYYNCKYCLSN